MHQDEEQVKPGELVQREEPATGKTADSAEHAYEDPADKASAQKTS